MKINDIITEAPLPPDWDPQEFKQGQSTFKSRLAYALDRAKKVGAGSSRVVMSIDYEGRQTALKVAKNRKGLAQNAAEANILDDGYARQLGILIPLVDFDREHNEPLWIQTELATRASEKKLCSIIKCSSLWELVSAAKIIGGKGGMYNSLDELFGRMHKVVLSNADRESITAYANALADVANSFDVQLGDFNRAGNWGIYQGKPVLIDIGLTTDVWIGHYR